MPYLNIYYVHCGISSSQIGALSAVRPWVSAVAAVVGSSTADRYRMHQSLLIFAFIASTLLRSFIGLTATFPAILMLVATTEIVSAPTGILADTFTMQTCVEVSCQG